MMSARSRLRQGMRALIGFTRPIDYALAAAHLSETQMALFRRMRHVEQLHSLNVLRALRAGGTVDEALAVAALLHDVGKSCYPLALWQKVAAVLLRRFIPRAVARWSTGDPAQAWMRPFVVYAHHPAWSADLLRAAGSAADAVWLAQHHQDDPATWRGHPLHPALLRLQAADDLN
jgi:hypothetical protein